MRTLILGILSFVVGLAMVSSCQAQGLAMKLDLKTGVMTPSVSMPVMEFESILGFKAKSQIVAFAGSSIANGAIVGGGAWVIEFPLAQGSGTALRGFIGPSLDFEQGKPSKLGLVFGVRF